VQVGLAGFDVPRSPEIGRRNPAGEQSEMTGWESLSHAADRHARRAGLFQVVLVHHLCETTTCPVYCIASGQVQTRYSSVDAGISIDLNTAGSKPAPARLTAP